VKGKTLSPHVDENAPIVGYSFRSAENLTDRPWTRGYFAAECLVFLLLLDSRHQARTRLCPSGLFYSIAPRSSDRRI